MLVMVCTLVCRTCTQHEDAPQVLVSETVDHDAVGADHHERLGGCFAWVARHLAAWPAHELVVTHETEAEAAAREQAAAGAVEQRQASRGYIDPEESIRRRLLKLESLEP